MNLPGAPHIAYRGSELCIEQCSLGSLAQRFGTPLYAYSLAAMEQAHRAYRSALQGRAHLICYAMKANSNLAILQTFARLGCGFDIVSVGELERVLAAGASPSSVLFSGVGKTRAEMRRALEVGVLCFNVESQAELEVLSEVATQAATTARISLRINPDVDAGTHPYISTGLKSNKFGIAHEDALATYGRAAALPRIEVIGIDCHIGSQITQIEPYLDAVDRLLDLVERVESQGISIPHLDVGGGLGITYSNETPPTPTELVRALLQRIDSRGHSQRKILFEPGRSLVGNAGVLVSEVLVLKTGAEKNFCVVDAAMNDLMRPALYGAWMDIRACLVRDGRDGAAALFDVVGPICESGDWLGRDRTLDVRVGDHIAVLSAGAYSMSMASNYNSRPRAAEVMVSGSQAWLIREREQLSELFRSERLLPANP
ncbi:MAG: diaminopimelate decarboxylase [Burkholderiaceae bacterium]